MKRAPALSKLAAAGAAAAAGWPSGSFTYFEFDKAPKGVSSTKSTLKFVRFRNDPDRPRHILLSQYRAGSGDGSKNTCRKNHGWLPNGTYKPGGKKPVYYAHHSGDVNGISWYVGNHKCHDSRYGSSATSA